MSFDSDLSRALMTSFAAVYLMACANGEDRSAVLEYTSLARLAENQEVLEGKPLIEYVWSLNGDHRAALFQHPPSRVRLGPIESAPGCRVRFAIGINEPAWSDTDGVTFRIFREPAVGATAPLFEELLEPRRLPGPAWFDREVEIPFDPSSEESNFHLVLETGPGPFGSFTSDHGAWANAHVVCPRPRPARRPIARPHVILISLDTLRPDHLGLSGYERETSPNMDALAKESLVFENAFAPAPWTLPSHASIFTGVYPSSHGAGYQDPFDSLDERLPTLAEQLRANGYRTVAFVAGGLVSRKNGLARGFDRWSENIKASLESTLPHVFDEIGLRPQTPLFLFIHTYDIHGPYNEGPSRYHFDVDEPSDAESVARSEMDWRRILELGYHRYQHFERFHSLGEVVAAYDAGIRRTDAVLGRLFRRLRELGIYDQALIIVTSDHGESLYDRGLFVGHSFTLYDEDVRIPLIVHLPGAEKVGHRTELVDLTDIMPLVLDVAGVSEPAGLEGSSPLARIDGAAPRKEFTRGGTAYSGAQYIRSLRWKFISAPHPLVHPASRVPGRLRSRFEAGQQGFDLRSDPEERRNLLSGHRATSAELERLRRQLLRLRPPGTGTFDPAVLDPERSEELKSLGYVQ